MIIGHQQNIALLDKMAQNNALSHAYLFVGPSGVGKRHVALEFSKWLQGKHARAFTRYAAAVCTCTSCGAIEGGTHPDVQIYDTADIEAIRGLKRESRKSPFVGPLRIYIIDRADSLGQEAVNALLKEIEEPATCTVFFLIARSMDVLPATVVSRCFVFRFSKVPALQLEQIPFIKRKTVSFQDLEALWQGRPGVAWRLHSDKGLRRELRAIKDDVDVFVRTSIQKRFTIIEKLCQKNRSDILEILEAWIAFLHEQKMYLLVDRVQNVRQTIERYNANPRIALEHVAVHI